MARREPEERSQKKNREQPAITARNAGGEEEFRADLARLFKALQEKGAKKRV